MKAQKSMAVIPVRLMVRSEAMSRGVARLCMTATLPTGEAEALTAVDILVLCGSACEKIALPYAPGAHAKR
jgi:hypothetical protein